MRYFKSFELNSSICSIDEIINLYNFLSEKAKKDTKGICKEKVEMILRIKNEEECSCNSESEVIRSIKNNFKFIRGIRLLYWGNKIHIEIKTIDYSKKIYVNLGFEEEGVILECEKFIKKIFYEKSWNNHFTLITLLLAGALSLLTGTLLIFLNKKFLYINQHLTFLLVFIYFNILEKLDFLYPAIVLVDDDRQSGRILKRDLWFIITILLLPYFKVLLDIFGILLRILLNKI
ncbi:MAG: hypothetical protein ACPLKP_01815 [Microgenomates group bacterium]